MPAKSSILLVLIASFGLVLPVFGQDTLAFEDFEDALVHYSPSDFDDITRLTSEDYYGRIDTTSADYLASEVEVSALPSGTHFYGAQDTNGATNPDSDLEITLLFADIDISGHTDVMVSLWLAEDDDGTDEDWDSNSSFRVEVQVDNAGFVTIFQVENSGPTFNTAPFVDTDFDGVGDGTEITDTFAQFTSAVGITGTTLDVRLVIENLGDGDEDIAIDDLVVFGTAPVVSSPPTCTINSPTSGSHSGVITVDFDIANPLMDPMDVDFEYSTNGGASFFTATDDGAGTATGTADGLGDGNYTFTWASDEDLVGSFGAEPVVFQLTVFNETTAEFDTCQVALTVDNEPTCTINSPAPGSTQGGVVTVNFDVINPALNGTSVEFDYSIDGGMSFDPASDAGTGSVMDGDSVAPISGGLTFDWQTDFDALGLTGAESVLFRITITDETTTVSNVCDLSLDIDNVPGCTITGPTAASTVGGLVGVVFTPDNPAPNTVTVDFDVSTNGGSSFSAATDEGGGTVTDGEAGITPGSSLTFNWQSDFDAGFTTGPEAVVFRITVTDDLTTASDTCLVTYTVDNFPECVLNSPMAGDTVDGVVTIDFDVSSPAPNNLDIEFNVSTDGGSSFGSASDALAGTVANPDNIAQGTGLTFSWESYLDAGQTSAEAVIFQIVVTDELNGASDTCELSLVADNRPTLVINSPLAGATVTGPTTIDLTTTNPAGNSLDVVFLYDHAAAGFNPATNTGGGPLGGNPASQATAGNDTWVWDSAADAIEGDVTLRVIVSDSFTGGDATAEVVLTADNTPSCVINSPTSGTESGSVIVDFDITNPSGNTVSVALEYSTDGGSSFSSATDGTLGSLSGNPVSGVSPGTGLTYDWNSDADAVGLEGAEAVIFRILVTDGVNGSADTCTTSFSVDNELVCVLNSPSDGADVAGAVTLDFTTNNPAGNSVDVTFSYSDDGGATFANTPTNGAGGSISGSPSANQPAAGNDTWVWNSVADVEQGTVIMRLFFVDMFSGSSDTCDITLEVDNRPDLTLTDPVAGDTVAAVVSFDFSITNPTGTTNHVVSFDYSTDGGATFSPAADAGSGGVTGNPSTVFGTVATSWDWDSFSDLGESEGPVLFRVIATNIGNGYDETTTVSLVVQNLPTVVINSPADGATVREDQTIDFTTTSPTANSLDVSFEYSTDGGTSYSSATDLANGSVTGNPASQAAAGNDTWGWDSVGDNLGVASAEAVLLRLIATDSGTGAADTAEISLTVDNQPECTVSSPADGADVSGVVTFEFTTTNPEGSSLEVSFAYSTDGGSSFSPATDAGTGSLTGNPAPQNSAGNDTWDWNSALDVIEDEVIFRIIALNTTTGGADTCELSLDVDNRPTVTIDAPAAGAAESANVSIGFTTTNPAGSTLTVSFDYSTDGGTSFSPATDAGGGSVTGNPAPQSSGPGSDTWDWQSNADAGGDGAETVLFRVIVEDTSTGGLDTATVSFDVDSQPRCIIGTPSAGDTRSDEVDILFSGSQATGQPITTSFSYSTDGGASFVPMTAASSSGTANPDSNRSSPFVNASFTWDSQADGVGLGGAASTILRLILQGGSGAETCEVALTIDNAPTCTLDAPTAGADVAGFVDITFGGNDPSFDDLTTTFSFSTDGGATFSPATADGSVSNPDASRATPFDNVTFVWDTHLDGAGLVGAESTIVRVVTTDPFGGADTCEVTVSIDNQPSCMITEPIAGTVTFGEIDVVFDAEDPSDDDLSSLLEFSIDGGATFSTATVTQGSPLSNPDFDRGSPFTGETFSWDSDADMVGQTIPDTVTLRIIVDDGFASDTCTVGGVVVGRVLDWGDAPDPSYPTLAANDGARHTIGTLFLGADADDELDGQPDADALGDDNDGNDDEDGIAFTTSFLLGGTEGSVVLTSSEAGLVDAWIDFDADGVWESGERIAASFAVDGTDTLYFEIPEAGLAPGISFARFRLSSAGGLLPTGLALDGEVEDHAIELDVDLDRDGLRSLVEDSLGTSDANRDTDGDGIEDGVEQATGSDPTMMEFFTDTDGDGIPDSVDPAPANPDANGNGIADGLELNGYGTFADLDRDGDRDSADLQLLMNAVFRGNAGTLPALDGDINRDGTIDRRDILEFVLFLRGVVDILPRY